jgi:hypothetical protein
MVVLAAILFFQAETLPPQPPVITQVQEQMKREMRRGWLRVVLLDRTLEVRGERRGRPWLHG